MGGYTTWPARSACLEVEAEPKIVEGELKLLEEVTGKPRRALPKLESAYSEAVTQSKPRGYWRLNEVAGSSAFDASGRHLEGKYDDNIAHYLPGPPGDGLSANGMPSRSTHFAGGRMRADVPDVGAAYSVEFWFWNGLPNDARGVTAYLFNRGGTSQSSTSGDCFGIGGSRGAAGKLFFSNGDNSSRNLEGRTTIEPRSWNHIALVREGKEVRVYLNGESRPEIEGELPVASSAAGNEWFFAGNGDNSSNLEGKMSEVALYSRALTADEVGRHYRAAQISATNREQY
jgi:hypothetical protein